MTQICKTDISGILYYIVLKWVLRIFTSGATSRVLELMSDISECFSKW